MASARYRHKSCSKYKSSPYAEHFLGETFVICLCNDILVWEKKKKNSFSKWFQAFVGSCGKSCAGVEPKRSSAALLSARAGWVLR